MTLFLIISAFVLALYCFIWRIVYVHETLDEKIKAERFAFEVRFGDLLDKIEKEWDEKSWAGNDPLAVVALAHIMAEKDRLGYQQPLHLTTSYYSQVKYLVKKGRLPTALAFFLRARKYSLIALVERSADFEPNDKVFRRAIDLEVIGATDFMMASMLGIRRKQAIMFLLEAEKEVTEAAKRYKEAKELGYELPQPNSRTERALIWSKLCHLTHEGKYRDLVLGIKFKTEDRVSARGQYDRIARHIGFKGADEMFAMTDPKEPPQEEASQQSASPAVETAKPGPESVPGARRVDPLFPGAGPRAVLPRSGLRLAGNPDNGPSAEGTPPVSSSGDGPD